METNLQLCPCCQYCLLLFLDTLREKERETDIQEERERERERN